MESDKLYRVQKEDLPKVEKMLNQCFAHDPLYETLIPDPEVRKNLMPELFKCDMDEFYATCEIFADSADLEDPSLKTFRNFMKGEDYLNSSWTDQLHQNQRLHIIYLAVDPSMQHHGIAAELLEEAIDYAQKHKLMISLETHNPKNVEFYEKFGFKVYGVMEKNFPLKQYCLIREVQ